MELSKFISEVLNLTFNHKTDQALVTGDFNIIRNKYPQEFYDKLVKINGKQFEQCLIKLNNEYNDVLLKNLIKTNQNKFEIEDLWNQIEEKKQITYGDVVVNNKTKKEEPAEKILSLPIEYCSKQVLDYIFHLKSIK